ncbi:MAG: glutamate--tRNA ligase [Bacilli bacterium]|nr:glutamate--tRNA ligase [Bacilli bacterium]
MTNKELADLIFPNITKTVDDYEKMYPERDLPNGAMVTRFAPSPTGFVHMGSLLASFISSKAAKDTDGVFYLRIEDTDQKREVENGIEGIVDDLNNFKISIDEGALSRDKSIGNYGPYIQSERKEIYHAFIKYLIEKGLAYPCFCSEERIEETRKMQEATKARIGYYGRYAVCRNIKLDDAYNKIKNGEKFIIRLKSPGDFEKKVVINDLVKGKIEFPENDLDIVIMKSDGLPTYHFAHLVDDHLMRTTHITRGDEWVSSLPIHIQLFQVFGFNPPKYAHLSPIMKQEGDTRRKLSKRKDPEAAMSYYTELGIPVEAVHLYLMTIANTNFEAWYDQNKDKTLNDFKFDFKKISSSGALFDVEKLINISRNYISFLKAEEVYENVLNWSKTYDNELYQLLNKYKEYTINIFSIERYQKKPRKDYESWSSIKKNIWYMYDELFIDVNYDYQKITDIEEINNILTTYIDKYYNESDDKETWFNKIKELSDSLGYCSNMKEYKENPDNYKGSVADVSTVIRVALTSSSMTPDLYEIMKLLGLNRIKQRIQKVIK